MAARRLVIVMLVLLGVSTLAAVFVPIEPEEVAEETTTAPAPAPVPEPRQRGELVRERLSADADRPGRVVVESGDQLALTVSSREADEVVIPGLGLLEPVAPLAPARFDLLLDEEAEHAVRLVDADRLVGRIVVEAPPDE